MSSESSVSIFEEVSCRGCGKSMGEFDVDELIVLMLEGIDSVKCFDCEPKESDQVPAIYKSWLTVSANKERSDGFNALGRGNDAQPRAHEHTRARGLSSVTYLNTTKHNRVGANGIELDTCLLCGGLGKLPDEYGVPLNCGLCEGRGVLESAIVLPRWLLGLGGEHA